MTARRERPIAFTGPLVCAILHPSNPKTETRRLRGLERINLSPDRWELGGWQDGHPDGRPRAVMVNGTGEQVGLPCPFGNPGDRLWVRETWRPLVRGTVRALSGDAIGDALRAPERPQEDDVRYGVEYQADGAQRWEERTTRVYVVDRPSAALHLRNDPRWRPPMFMPRRAARIMLDVLAVRLHRLQDITEAEILAEGVTVDRVAAWTRVPWSSMPTLHDAWRVLWDFINGKRGHSYARDPWVWAITFARMTP